MHVCRTTKRMCQTASLQVGVSGELEHSEWACLKEQQQQQQKGSPDVSHASSEVKPERGKLACCLRCAKENLDFLFVSCNGSTKQMQTSISSLHQKRDGHRGALGVSGGGDERALKGRRTARNTEPLTNSAHHSKPF